MSTFPYEATRPTTIRQIYRAAQYWTDRVSEDGRGIDSKTANLLLGIISELETSCQRVRGFGQKTMKKISHHDGDVFVRGQFRYGNAEIELVFGRSRFPPYQDQAIIVKEVGPANQKESFLEKLCRRHKDLKPIPY